MNSYFGLCCIAVNVYVLEQHPISYVYVRTTTLDGSETCPVVATSNFRKASNANLVINSLIPLSLTRGPSHVLAHTWPTNQYTYVGQWSSLNGNLTAGPRFSLSEIKIYRRSQINRVNKIYQKYQTKFKKNSNYFKKIRRI